MRSNKLMVDNPASAIKDWQLELRQAMFDAVRPEDVQQIAQGLVAKAKQGDQAAIKLLFTYILGSGSINIRQGVVISGDQQQAPPGRPRAEALPRPPAEESEDDNGPFFMIVGTNNCGERVSLGDQHDLERAKSMADVLHEKLEGYSTIAVERFGIARPVYVAGEKNGNGKIAAAAANGNGKH